MVMIRMIAKHPSRADGQYEGSTGLWSLGMERDIVPEEAEQLLDDFGACFERVSPGPASIAGVLPTPTDDGNTGATGLKIDPGTVPVKTLKSWLVHGRFDGCLPALLAAEKQGQKRLMIRKAVIHRSHRIGVSVDESPWR